MTTYVLTTGYKCGLVAHREKHQDIPACAAYTTGRWERIEIRHARLLNLTPCQAVACFKGALAIPDPEGQRQ